MLLLIQLAGVPGAGKSTLARALAKRYNAVVLDMDVVKTALLDADAPWQLAGRGAYAVHFALADDLLGRGHNVVIDSPSYYPIIPERGTAIAERHGARYRFIECVCDDIEELRRRLLTRTRLRSQMRDIGLSSPDAGEIRADGANVHKKHTCAPDGGHLVVDSMQPPERVAELVFGYVDQPIALPE